MTDMREDLPGFGPRSSLSEQIYRSLRLSLMAGGFQPGARLNISRLAESFGTSVTPVREAVFQLVREQALELKRGYQPRVPVLEVSRYIKLRETRAPLERLATELATPHITPDDLDALRELHRQFVAREEAGDFAGALAANQAFHFRVYAASKNPVLVGVIENLWLIAGPFTTNQYPALRNARTNPHPHEILLDALRRKSAGEAGDAVVNDLRDASFALLRQMEAQRPKARRAGRPSAGGLLATP